MKIKNWVLGIIVLIFIFGGIGITMAFNQWQTESTKTPAKYTSGDYAGESNPADIRGSYSFSDISYTWDIPLSTLAAAFNVSTVDAAAFKCNELETIYAGLPAETEIGTDSVRVFVALYTGLPYSLAETTYLPSTATDILLAEASLDEARQLYIEQHTIDIEAVEPITPVDTTLTENITHEEVTEEGVIKGKTTFRDLLDWGLTGADIEAVIGTDLPPTGTSIRDYAVAQGIEFSVIKTELQAKLDALK